MKLITDDYAKFSCVVGEISQETKDDSETFRKFSFSIYIPNSVPLLGVHIQEVTATTRILNPKLPGALILRSHLLLCHNL